MRRRHTTVFGIVSLLAAQITGQAPVASYTTSQAQAGEVAYQDVCASCHMPDLAGAFEAPQLAGPSFLTLWGGLPTSDLFAYIKVAMPPAGQKPSDETLTNIVAYILQQNGTDAGDTPLVPTTHSAIGTAAPQRHPAGATSAAPPVGVAFLAIDH